jgi:hypothetical protein
MQRQKDQQRSAAALQLLLLIFKPQACACGYMLSLHSQLEKAYLQILTLT